MTNRKRPFLEILRNMKGKTFIYANKAFVLKDYSIDDAREKVNVITDQKTFEKTYDSIGDFLDLWEPVPTDSPSTGETPKEGNNQVAVPSNNAIAPVEEVFVQQTNLAVELVDILKKNIDKVQKDKNYIQQAEVVNKNVNTIISVTKLQLEVYKQMKQKKTA